jgi:hypothetical protein
VGSSVSSALSNPITIPNIPGIPVITSARHTTATVHGQPDTILDTVTVSWTESNEGGLPTNYTVTSIPDGITATRRLLLS